MKYLLLSLLFLIGCGTLPDILACTGLDANSGACTHMLTGGRVDINASSLYNGQTWPQVLSSAVIVPADQWTLLEEFIVNYCKQNKCTAQMATTMNQTAEVFERIESLSLN